jgi:hypothetical protein
MKWLDKWFYKKCKKAWESRDEMEQPQVDKQAMKIGSPLSSGSNTLRSENGLNCRLYKASGGYVVEFQHYDNRTDRNNNTVHVIPDAAEFGDSFSKIVTLELMRI